MQPIEERLELVRFKVDKTAHIRVNSEACQGCDLTPCVVKCIFHTSIAWNAAPAM
jgi:ferredoxin like protein